MVSRDASGYQWGKYHKEKNQSKARKKIPCIYLLIEESFTEKKSREQIKIKVGQTIRNPLTRKTETSGNFKLVCYWPINEELLTEAEISVISECQKKFGDPCQGKEFFYSPSRLEAIQVVSACLDGVDAVSAETPPSLKEHYQKLQFQAMLDELL